MKAAREAGVVTATPAPHGAVTTSQEQFVDSASHVRTAGGFSSSFFYLEEALDRDLPAAINRLIFLLYSWR